MTNITKYFEKNPINLITYTDPYTKTLLMRELITKSNNKIIYLDFDLLFSGYINADIIKKSQNLSLFQIQKQTFEDIMHKTILEISSKKTIVIIDSINVFYNVFTERNDVGRFVNTSIMLLTKFAKISNSIILVNTFIPSKENLGDEIPKYVISSEFLSKFFLEMKKSFLTMITYPKEIPEETMKIEIDSELVP